MCRVPCGLAMALSIGVALAHSWDIAVSVKEQLIFLTHGTKTGTVNLSAQNPTSLVYDEIHNMMLYVDKQNGNDAVCGYDLTSRDNKCFIERNNRDIHGIAFDPATEMIFFTDQNERSINWISLKPEVSNNIHGNLLLKLDDGTPADITVDSCRGNIYWSYTDEKIERANFNGCERVIYDGQFIRYSLFIDLQTQQIFYLDEPSSTSPPWYGYLNKNNLNMTSELWILQSIYFKLKALTVSKDYVYWVKNTGSNDSVWQLSKYAVQSTEGIEISNFADEKTLGITAKYNIVDQVEGIQDCAPLSNLIPKLNVPPGNTDERPDVSTSGHYCLHGDTSFDDEGLPKCRCDAGYSGQRCEVNVCFNFCLNGGNCFLNEEAEPGCECDSNHEGSRCEAEITADADPTTPAVPAYDFALV